MKKIYRYTLILGALLLALPTKAQETPNYVKADGLVVDKKLLTPDADDNGQYYLEISAYATGTTVVTTTTGEQTIPVDAVLALDFSTSMVTDQFLTPIALTKGYTSKNTIIEGEGSKDPWDATNVIIEGKTYTTFDSENYFYKFTDDRYYPVSVGNTGNNQTFNYYYQYTKDGNTYYLNPTGGGSSTNKPEDNTDANRVYTGNLYQPKTVYPDYGTDIYYAWYTDGTGQKKVWYNNAWANAFGNYNDDYRQAHDEATETIFTGQLYNANQELQDSKNYNYNDLVGGNYYVGETTTYYYLTYNDGTTDHYLKADGTGTTTEMPTTVSKSDGNVFKGPLYKRTETVAGPNCYYAYYEDAGKKNYIVYKDNKYTTSPNINDINKNVQSEDAEAYNGTLYTVTKEGKKVTIGNETKSFSFNDLESGSYYYPTKPDPNKEVDLKLIKVVAYDPNKPEEGTISYSYQKDGDANKQWKWQDYKDDHYYKYGDGETDYALVTKGSETVLTGFYQVHAEAPTNTSDPTTEWVVTNKTWKTGDVNNTDKIYYYKDGSEYYQVSSNKEVVGQITGGYYLSFTVGETKYYITDEGYTTTLAGANFAADADGVIYNGPLYGFTRLTALQAAMCDFIDDVAEMNENPNNDNRVGIVGFDMDVDGTLPLEKITTDNADNYKQFILEHGVKTGTDHADAMTGCQTMINDIATDRKSNKIVVMFTDGETYNGDESTRTTRANNALVTANEIKASGASIYTITLLTDSKRKSFPWIDYLVRYMSSWFNPSVETVPTGATYSQEFNENSLDRTGRNDENKGFYIAADAGDGGVDLSEAFEIVADEIGTETKIDDPETLGENIMAVDVMTSYFKLPPLPEAADPNSIVTLEVQKCTDVTGEGDKATYTFGNRMKPSDAGITGVNVNINGKEVDVSGFNYGENFCGQHAKIGDDGQPVLDKNGDPVYEPGGYKLIITIPIVVDEHNPGGANLPTNEAISGIYRINENGEKGKKISSLVDPKDQPQVNLPNIVIKKSGLQPGHSATFKIEKVGDNDNTPVSVDVFKPFYVTLTGKEGAPFVSTKVKLNAPGRYKVTETSWSWGYDPEATSAWTIKEPQDGQGVDERVTFKASTVVNNNGHYIVRTVSHDTEETIGQSSTGAQSGITHENLGTLFPFVNSYNPPISSTKFSEAYKVNKFATPIKYTIGKTETDNIDIAPGEGSEPAE